MTTLLTTKITVRSLLSALCRNSSVAETVCRRTAIAAIRVRHAQRPPFAPAAFAPAATEPCPPSLRDLMSDVEARAVAFGIIKACNDVSWQVGAVAERLVSGTFAHTPAAPCQDRIAIALGIAQDHASDLIAEAKRIAHRYCITEMGIDSPWGI